jgi:DNA-directed RNA polymerase subunit M/transcription elongation factor TFIIS
MELDDYTPFRAPVARCPRCNAVLTRGRRAEDKRTAPPRLRCPRCGYEEAPDVDLPYPETM